MPFVNIKLIPDGITTQQKEKLIAGVTDLLHDVLGNPREATTVCIEEIGSDNWGKGGESLTVIRQRNAKK